MNTLGRCTLVRRLKASRRCEKLGGIPPAFRSVAALVLGAGTTSPRRDRTRAGAASWRARTATQRLMSARSCRQRWHCRSARSRHSGGRRRRQSPPCLPSSQQACAVWKAEMPPCVPKCDSLVAGRRQCSAWVAPAVQGLERQLRPQLQRLPLPASLSSRAGLFAQMPCLRNPARLRLQVLRLSAANAELPSRWLPRPGRCHTSSGDDTTASLRARRRPTRTTLRRITTAQPPAARTPHLLRGLSPPTLPSAATATGRRVRTAPAAARAAAAAAARPRVPLKRVPPKRSAFASAAAVPPPRPRAVHCQPFAGVPAAALEAATSTEAATRRTKASMGTHRLESPAGTAPATATMMLCIARVVQRGGEARVGRVVAVAPGPAMLLGAQTPLRTGEAAGQRAGG